MLCIGQSVRVIPPPKGEREERAKSRASIGSGLEIKDFGSDVFKTLQQDVLVAPRAADAEGASNISLKPRLKAGAFIPA